MKNKTVNKTTTQYCSLGCEVVYISKNTLKSKINEQRKTGTGLCFTNRNISEYAEAKSMRKELNEKISTEKRINRLKD